MRNRQVRLAHASLAAAVGTLATATAHTVGGGHFPAPLVLALAFVVSVLANLALLGRRMTIARLIPAAAIGQGVLHVAFTAAAAPPHPSGTGQHSHHGHVSMDLAAAAMTHGDSMLLGHIAAGIVTVVSLRTGARACATALRSLALWAARIIALALRHETPAPTSSPRAVDVASASAHTEILGRSIRRRGPPLAALIV